MPELRQDPIVGRWVIYSSARSARPHDFEPVMVRRADAICPFCAGHEHLAPIETFAIRAAGSTPNQPGWRVRVVSNKFPALEGEGAGRDLSPLEAGYLKQPGLGVHEVIVESPRHLTTTTELEPAELAEVLAVYRQRLTALAADPRLRYGMVFKNVGVAAGASLEHLHSQLIGMPVVPSGVAEKLAGAERYFAREGGCPWCRMADEARADGRRWVAEEGELLAFCPYAARFPWETWIVPRRHASDFRQSEDAILAQLAQLIRRVIGRLERQIPGLAYNYIIQTAPFDTHALDHYHWHMEIIPRLSNLAGFEWGSGCFINPVLPEDAAERLRQPVGG